MSKADCRCRIPETPLTSVLPLSRRALSDVPLSAAVRGDGVLNVSGQVPVDPQTRQVVEGGIEAQTRQTLTTFTAMNGVYREYFANEPPARTTVGTTSLASPAMQIEIEAIALSPES